MKDASDNWIGYRLLAAIVLIALILRVVAIGAKTEELTIDRDAYIGMAMGIAEGRGLCVPGSSQPTAFRPPLYPIALGGSIPLLGVATAVATLNVCFGLITVYATWLAARKLGLGGRAHVAAGLVAIDPLLLRYSSQPMTEVFCAGLIAVWLLVSIHDEKNCRRNELLSGGLFGGIVLCRPAFWPLIALIGCVLLCRQKQSQTRDCNGIRDVMSPNSFWRFCAGAGLVVMPWIVRNQIIFGRPILTTTHGGYTLFLANNDVFYREVVRQPWGTVWENESLLMWQRELDDRLEKELGRSASEYERDRAMSLYAKKVIVREPQLFLWSILHRVRSLWAVTPNLDSKDGTSRSVIQFVGIYYSILLMAFLGGMIRVALMPDRLRWLLVFALVLVLQVVHLFYWTNARMRAPITPALALFVAALMARRSVKVGPIGNSSMESVDRSAGMTGAGCRLG